MIRKRKALEGVKKENGGMDKMSIPPFNWRIFLPA